ncbi:hypothetical protein sync_0588 [Synechococcus sp. CC9311]|nr:hypothetical protein sync_0588 [Synechococcus sp. CC9311]
MIFSFEIKRSVHSLPLQMEWDKVTSRHIRPIIGDAINQQVNFERVLI